jgi:hypothetical protein
MQRHDRIHSSPPPLFQTIGNTALTIPIESTTNYSPFTGNRGTMPPPTREFATPSPAFFLLLHKSLRIGCFGVIYVGLMNHFDSYGVVGCSQCKAHDKDHLAPMIIMTTLLIKHLKYVRLS